MIANYFLNLALRFADIMIIDKCGIYCLFAAVLCKDTSYLRIISCLLLSNLFLSGNMLTGPKQIQCRF